MNVTDITTPSSRLSDNFEDPAQSHISEDEILWDFINFVYAYSNGDNTKERFLRNEAKAFLDWNDKCARRERWYA